MESSASVLYRYWLNGLYGLYGLNGLNDLKLMEATAEAVTAACRQFDSAQGPRH